MAAAQGGLVGRLVAVLETYRGRDRAMRTLSYGCQLAGGALLAGSPPAPLGDRLLALAQQLSHCRTVLRLFDDLTMLTHTCHYGLGGQEEDAAVRWLSVLNNLADQLYYPCEHVAWAADAEILRANSQKWWALSTALWGASLLLGIARSLRILAQIRSKLQTPPRGPRKMSVQARDKLNLLTGLQKVLYGKKTLQPSGPGPPHPSSSSSLQASPKELRAQAAAEALTILSNMADLANAVHWLPPGVLWAGKSPPWLVGLMGTVSSLAGLYQTCIKGSAKTA